jgi:hypothetical protein
MTLFARLTLAIALIASCSTALADGVTPFCDLLYWHASAEASSVWANVDSTTSTTSSLSAENLRFDWQPGFRFGFGHQADEDSWDAKLYWTYFRTSQNADLSLGDWVVGAPEFFSGFVSLALFSQGSIDWSLNYNTIDLEVGRKLILGESAWIRPSMGIKTAFIQQNIRLNYSSPDLLDPFVTLTAAENVDHDFWGIGPSFGITGAWSLPRPNNLSLIGSFSADFLFGQWNVNDAYGRTDAQNPLGVYGAFTTSMTDSCLGVPVLRYFLGLEWVRQGNVTITARVGYELQWWANQQRILAFQQLPMHGDLTLEGLTCGVSVGF